MKIYFFPHSLFRDRQFDTIRRWSRSNVLNPELAKQQKGAQVSAKYANAPTLRRAWKQKIPLLNIKIRPKQIPKDAVVYVWGALVTHGPFIIDLDNPWSLVGYNLRAMPFYKSLIKAILYSERCREIRCMSEACHQSLGELFGQKVYEKARVHYPYMPQVVSSPGQLREGGCKFLFIGTQFEIKGGAALLNAFKRVYRRKPDQCHLDMITHLPDEYKAMAEECEGITVHKPIFSRDEIHSLFMKHTDVLVLPTYVDSFGMVALEALAHGVALIATDVYALGEMVEEGGNGNLLSPPLSIWDGVMPSSVYYDLHHIKKRIAKMDTGEFELKLEQSIERFVDDPIWRHGAKMASIKIMGERFLC